jgi:hypothetical protein
MSKPPVHWSYAEQRYWIDTPDGVEWFDGPLEAEDAAAAIDRQKAAQAERDRIAAWLRRIGKPQLADAILRGEYQPKEPTHD